MGDIFKNLIESLFEIVIKTVDLSGTINTIATNSYGLFNENGPVSTIMGAISVVGFSICALFFIMSLVDLAMSDRFSIETFAKHFINLAIGVFGVTHAKYFVNFGWGLSEWVSNLIAKASILGGGESTATISAQASELVSSLDLSGLKWLAIGIAGMLIGLLGAIASAIATAAVYLAGFSRLLEMGLRACFMPIGLAFMTDDGWKGAGGRYLKKFVSLCCQGAAYVVVGKVHASLMVGAFVKIAEGVSSGSLEGVGASIGALLSFTAILLAGTFAAVSLLFKCNSIVNDVFGV